MKHQYTVRPSSDGKGYDVVEDGEAVVRHEATKAAATAEARKWAKYNGPPVTGLSSIFRF